MNDTPALRILLVEDDENDRVAFHRIFQKSNPDCKITECVNAEEALRLLEADDSLFDVAAVDHGLPGMSGLALCKKLLDSGMSLPLIIMTGAGSEELAVEALKSGVYDYMVKDDTKNYLDLLPIAFSKVVRMHSDRMARIQAEEALSKHQKHLEEIVKERTANLEHEIEERKKAEKELLCKSEELFLMNKELHELTMEMTRVEEKERKQFAEMLHENIGQNLVAIKIACESGGHTPEILPIINETIQSTRSMTTDIYPPLLDKFGLIKAIKWYVESALWPKKIKVSLDISETMEGLEDDLKSFIYRIIRECFQNILKHSSASRVNVKIKSDNCYYLIKIKDNGIGFADEAIKVESSEGIGLKLIKEWVKSLKGRFDINSQPGKGTEISIAIPIEQ